MLHIGREMPKDIFLTLFTSDQTVEETQMDISIMNVCTGYTYEHKYHVCMCMWDAHININIINVYV